MQLNINIMIIIKAFPTLKFLGSIASINKDVTITY